MQQESPVTGLWEGGLLCTMGLKHLVYLFHRRVTHKYHTKKGHSGFWAIDVKYVLHNVYKRVVFLV